MSAELSIYDLMNFATCVYLFTAFFFFFKKNDWVKVT